MLYPLKFKPRFKERIWGGDALATRMGKKLPSGKKIGESWELSGVQKDISVVSNGKLKGNNLEELIEVYMGELVGEKVYEKFGVEFPLLIKLIDAQDVLSVQVHPDDELAAERHNSYGKTEMWYVIDNEPGAFLYVGFNSRVTREQYLEAVAKGTVADLLAKFEVKPADSYFIPAGTIHAIGKGLLIAEIQQTSDVTYRVDDWGRVDDNGNPRELHTELAVDAIDFGESDDFDVTATPIVNESVTIVDCPYFTTNEIELDGTLTPDYASLDSFVIYMCIAGSCKVGYAGGEESLTKGETMLVPADLDDITLSGKANLLEVYIK